MQIITLSPFAFLWPTIGQIDLPPRKVFPLVFVARTFPRQLFHLATKCEAYKRTNTLSLKLDIDTVLEKQIKRQDLSTEKIHHPSKMFILNFEISGMTKIR